MRGIFPLANEETAMPPTLSETESLWILALSSFLFGVLGVLLWPRRQRVDWMHVAIAVAVSCSLEVALWVGFAVIYELVYYNGAHVLAAGVSMACMMGPGIFLYSSPAAASGGVVAKWLRNKLFDSA
jgi:hypothetical protein